MVHMNTQYRTHMIGDLSSSLVGTSVRLAGWVHVVRAQSKIIFLVLRDYDGLVQCVVLPEHAEAFSVAKIVSQESVVSVEGTIVEAKQAQGGLEIQVTSLEVLSASNPELPIPVVERGGNETDQAIRLDYRWIDLRKPEKLLVFKIWTLFEEALRDFFIAERFLQIHSPKLMSSPSESGAEVFEVKYFERSAYLAQSPQFYKQMAMAAGFERVFEVGPVFRAEPSFTTRHATEFTGLDFEMSFIASHKDVMDIWSRAIASAMQRVADQYGEQIKQCYGIDVVVPSLPFPELTMEEAKALLSKRNITSEREGDLSPEEERALGGISKEKYGHEFIFITEYPASVRPFYHMRKEDDPNSTLSFDLIWKGVEITTGAQREHRYDILEAQAKEKGMKLDSIAHYLDFFRYGCPPHGGAGIGFGRMIMLMLNLESIREASYVYRGVKRLTP
ncbi:MAG: aspartate--tRNA(Asn) ligase [Candidatus Andersenbacteria bacterium RIFCSPHIGHO2_02_FULL_45_11]|uniref:Aspartate--tRNA ligase n=1 Tax=Candidatus Andersenbacteria bacterium RIFCSPHIGHO2_12_FULL_45_11 TaxID=1797281 RepID=A0A1G1X235_9BACT|nr:MAG: aspartate--tRNA(Asn) ligase [Candidatus Andersenbacteria bacterium RIFCSPHIGHO2_01_FULL_46_36]OGY31898.1 MAG: aspartate--tRNA(Asn) ligase [Candidatus Andersenbacteria bacterium RIFCSPHIGHO2_02_FULL_45_11]OGY34033.1 MAG: aspartate--tRNA(Asn) ligase [Candidatus Andersenbacteria bacterium RIFCSPHIGHO2_12_FULL_45_11]